nr:MAG TPA: hypothetical protein [Caudoviricetes sp.]
MRTRLLITLLFFAFRTAILLGNPLTDKKV